MISPRVCVLVSLAFPLVAEAQPEGATGDAADPASSVAAPAPAATPAIEVPALVAGNAPEPVREEPLDFVYIPDKPGFQWKPFGFMRLQYIAVQNDPNVAFVGRDDGFELQNARVGVHGKFADRATFTLSIDGAVDERAQNTPQGKLRVGLRDAFADVRLGDQLVARGGYFQTWVDPQGLVPEIEREFVDKPLESRGMRSTEGWYTPGLPPGRSLGAALRLEPKTAYQLGLELAVQNGSDEFASNNDNDQPALSGAALISLPNHGFLVVAGRWNPRTVGDLPFRQDETDLQGTVGAQFNASGVTIAGGAIVQRTTFESTGGPTQNAFGAHGQFVFWIPGTRAGVGYRFGILDPSSLIVTDRVMEHTVGAVLAVPSLRMRLQLQLTHVQEQAARELSNDRAQLAAEVAL